MKNKIKAYRKKIGMSQETLSKNVNVSRQTINAIENNKYDPTLMLAFKLAKQFDTTVDDLFSTK
ncbi:helix-turn-helix transcriptional regulator [Staphylococcus lugdunensis]|jgi:putative transcriptional regulator|uniref:DNA-binding helix-turn-helix protein n=2 Tax=Staphylococcus lugdunensis TaxID=28035 RepID=A0A133Q4Z7_STALU|nr:MULTISPECIES: helix-turn-helix transcriptional regulator [Bacilli]ADC86400.1 Transcriptional regulator, PBSX family [Staphylococcus lugdunensis HKU09-01]AMG61870.1 transcriptional regulator [Staphylococcus lugdunensis]AMG64202.1 transcriptional regulator [Staphylococcus lugdunensis]ARB78956.1 transcriptional regulator [Staphylococcus lugdunensis]ARJ08149.1 transcriptional regulator [Staphylococcus lugdunensis]